MGELAIVIPTLNEEKTIGKVIDDCIIASNKIKMKNNIECKIIVVDGNSKDKTREIAKHKNAHIISEERKGKGIAIISA
ncbi:MAG: glycosyltransferase, partial [Candidatus Methanofastidiosum sp.]|nr:glycosyltransferase [Methanofastidiosum sp.]